MKKFEFEITVIMEIEDTDSKSARECAEDWAYTVTDKGKYTIKELGEIE